MVILAVAVVVLCLFRKLRIPVQFASPELPHKTLIQVPAATLARPSIRGEAVLFYIIRAHGLCEFRCCYLVKVVENLGIRELGVKLG
jgi:hypothetical protein